MNFFYSKCCNYYYEDASYTPHHEDLWGSGVIAPLILTSALAGSEQSALCPGRFSPGIHWIGGWVVPTLPLLETEPRSSSA